METRGLRENEIEEAIAHVCSVFGKPGHPRFRYHLTGDSSFELEQARVCVVDGRIVSYLRISDRPIHIGFAVVRMGGIGAVTTDPEYRRRGCSGALLWDAIRYMERAHYDINMLFTGIPRHYARAGWVTFPRHTFAVVADDPPPLDTPYIVRDFDLQRDLDAVIEIYNQYNQQRTGTMARPRRYWSDPHSRDRGVLPMWLAECDGKVVAYMQGAPRHIGELAYLPGHREAATALCARAMRAANTGPPPEHVSLVFGERWPSHPRLSGDLPRSHPGLADLASWSPDVVCHIERESMMLRVIRLVPLMQKVAPVLESRLAQAGLLPRRKRITIREQGQAATIVIDGSHLHVEPGEDGDLILQPGSRNFFRLLLGDRTFSQVRDLIPGADAIAPQDAALLDILFPPQEPVYYRCDGF